MTYNEQGKRTSHENLASQVTTTAWDCCHKVSEVQPDGSTATWDYDVKNQLLQVCNAFPTNVISQYDYTYGSCRNGKRGYTWEMEIFVVDTVGLQPRDGIKYALFGRWLFKDGTLIMARWKLSGEGECSCCKDALEDIAR